MVEVSSSHMLSLRLLSGDAIDVVVNSGDSIYKIREKAADACGVPVPFVRLIGGKNVVGDDFDVFNIKPQVLHVQILASLPFEIGLVNPGGPQIGSRYWGINGVPYPSYTQRWSPPEQTAVVVRGTDFHGKKFVSAAVFAIKEADTACAGSWVFTYDSPVSGLDCWMSDYGCNHEPGIVECTRTPQVLQVDWYPSMEAARKDVAIKLAEVENIELLVKGICAGVVSQIRQALGN
jgi:hypothetical protein